MATLYKLILAFLFIFFLIGNSRGENLANGEVNYTGNGFTDGPHFSFLIPSNRLPMNMK